MLLSFGESNMKLKIEGKGVIGKLVALGGGTKVAMKSLEQTNIAPFEMVFNTARQLVEDREEKRWYMSALSYGDNWKVSKDTTADIATGPDNVGHMRIFYENDFQFFRAMCPGRKYVFKFTSPFGAYYRVSVNVLKGEAGGYVDIYLNDVCVARKVDTYSKTKMTATVKLGTHKLQEGRYANKIKIVPTSASNGEKNRPSFIGFSFEIA